MYRFYSKVVVCIVATTMVLLSASCTTTGGKQSIVVDVSDSNDAKCASGMPEYNPSDAQIECDEIFSLLAYAVVGKNWQTKKDSSRGYNIGSVLVDENNKILCWARNSVYATNNKTQHGEVRLMTNYLDNVNYSQLPSKAKLYTTLEPCAMCAGMMALQSLYLTVYGQTDTHFGDAIQRLDTDCSSCGGYKPYPRLVISVPSTLGVRTQIDNEYGKTPNASTTGWLITEEAKKLYDKALQDLHHYKANYDMSKKALKDAHKFLATVPDKYTAIPYAKNCPKW